MTTTALLRQNAISGAKRIVATEPLLPFLYNTRTIRREHTDALSGQESPPKYSTPKSRPGELRNRSEWTPRFRDNASGESGHRPTARKNYNSRLRPARHDNAGEVTDTSWRGTRNQYRRSVREEDIPFEHAAQETMSIRDKIQTSTMTPSEKRAFEELLSLRQRKETKDKSRHRDRDRDRDPLEEVKDKDTLNEVAYKDTLEEALTKASVRQNKNQEDKVPLPVVLKKMQENIQEDRSAAHRVLLEQAVTMDIQQVKKAFATAQTDVELWKIMHDKVLSRVASLDLETPAPKQPQNRKTQAGKPDDTKQTRWPGDIPDEQVITKNLPHHMVECARVLFMDFPASHLHTSLLPYLKSLGPTTFTLAASTKLYNYHMRSLFRAHGNLPQVVHTLEEMEKEVYEFDDKSKDLVDSILKRSRVAREETYGPGMRALWSGERFRKANRSILFWGKTIETRMQEKALREARAKEEETVQEAALY
jgi:hypothetical protein